MTRLSDNLEQWRAPSAMVAMLAGTLALLALILACTGVFATVACAVAGGCARSVSASRSAPRAKMCCG